MKTRIEYVLSRMCIVCRERFPHPLEDPDGWSPLHGFWRCPTCTKEGRVK